jgi:predicted flap endonuclease-1-like 5' DNA nuclease
MQEVEEFRKFLRKKGKKNHVVDGLIRRCAIFEEFMHKRSKRSMDVASKEDIQAFVDSIKDQKTDLNNYLRALSLYYRFKSKPELSVLTSKLREQRVSSIRKPHSLKDFRGVDPEYVNRLACFGIKNAEQILAVGRTRDDRQKLSEKIGVPAEAILEFVKLSDLSRIEGVKGIRARLYYDAGVDTVEKMAKWNPEKLRAHMVEFVKKSGFAGIAPLPKEVEYTVESATRLPKIIEP